MATHLLADVHLRGGHDFNTVRLKTYLAGKARAADALYVLGDLFDVWIGDDGSIPVHASILDAFAELGDSGVPLYFMRGNRDFAVGAAFAARSRFSIVDDPIVIDLQGTPTLLSHGDLLCTDDVAHQAFRTRYTDARWRRRMLKIPLWLRRYLAMRARRKSTAGKAGKPAHIMDVNAGTVARTMTAHGVHRLVHGHTHRPANHAVDLNGDHGDHGERIVIADWRPDQAEVLVVDANGVHRHSLLDSSTDNNNPAVA